jgi:hypothetical protein
MSTRKPDTPGKVPAPKQIVVGDLLIRCRVDAKGVPVDCGDSDPDWGGIPCLTDEALQSAVKTRRGCGAHHENSGQVVVGGQARLTIDESDHRRNLSYARVIATGRPLVPTPTRCTWRSSLGFALAELRGGFEHLVLHLTHSPTLSPQFSLTKHMAGGTHRGRPHDRRCRAHR